MVFYVYPDYHAPIGPPHHAERSMRYRHTSPRKNELGRRGTILTTVQPSLLPCTDREATMSAPLRCFPPTDPAFHVRPPFPSSSCSRLDRNNRKVTTFRLLVILFLNFFPANQIPRRCEAPAEQNTHANLRLETRVDVLDSVVKFSAAGFYPHVGEAPRPSLPAGRRPWHLAFSPSAKLKRDAAESAKA